MSNKNIYFYPLWLRIWHAVNALGILLLIISGISMQSNSETSILSFSNSVSIHNYSGIVVSIFYLLYFIGNIVTGNGKFYIIKQKGFLKRPIQQSKYYMWGMFNNMRTPYPLSEKRKFNPLQKYIYVIVMYLVVPMVIFTGVALFFPELIIERIFDLSGINLTAILHSALGFFISIFLIIHLYVASIGKAPLENYKSIITGWHHI